MTGEILTRVGLWAFWIGLVHVRRVRNVWLSAPTDTDTLESSPGAELQDDR